MKNAMDSVISRPEKIELPVNYNPAIRSYAHHGYFNCIETSSEKKANVDEAVALLYVNNFGEQNYTIKNSQLQFKRELNNLIFYANKWNTEMNSIFFRKINSNMDEVEIKIDYFLYSSPYATIKLFISELSEDYLENYNENLGGLDLGPSLGYFAKDGIYTSLQQYQADNIYNPHNKAAILKIVLRNNSLFGYIESDNYSSSEFLIEKLNEEKSYKTIGFAVCLGNNVYYENLFLNYINLEFYEYGKARLDFIYFPIKNFAVVASDYFIDVTIIDEKEIAELGLTTLDYIKVELSLRRYILMLINDNISCQKNDDNGSYFHADLIYGVDEDNQILLLLYYDHGVIKKGSISFKDFNSKRNQIKNRALSILNYNPGYETIRFTKEKIKKKFEEYLYPEENIEYHSRYDFLHSKKGINCIEFLAKKENIQYLIRDIRISHVLYERAVINRDRIEYLFVRKEINEEVYSTLIKLCEEEVTKTCILRNSILKMKMYKQFDEARIESYIKELFVLNKELSLKIINLLSQN